MKAVIIAAARSPRLLPLTKNIPASLLEVGGKPIIEHQLNALNDAGVKDILVVTGYCSEQIESLCKDRVTCVYNPYYEVSNVAMNLWLIRNAFGSDFIMQYNDTLFHSELIAELIKKEGNIVLVVNEEGVDKESEKVLVKNDLVIAIGKKVETPFGEFIGIAKFTQRALPKLKHTLEQVARTDLNMNFSELVELLLNNGSTVGVHPTKTPWFDIDFVSDLEEARRTW